MDIRLGDKNNETPEISKFFRELKADVEKGYLVKSNLSVRYKRNYLGHLIDYLKSLFGSETSAKADKVANAALKYAMSQKSITKADREVLQSFLEALKKKTKNVGYQKEIDGVIRNLVKLTLHPKEAMPRDATSGKKESPLSKMKEEVKPASQAPATKMEAKPSEPAAPKVEAKPKEPTAPTPAPAPKVEAKPMEPAAPAPAPAPKVEVSTVPAAPSPAPSPKAEDKPAISPLKVNVPTAPLASTAPSTPSPGASTTPAAPLAPSSTASQAGAVPGMPSTPAAPATEPEVPVPPPLDEGEIPTPPDLESEPETSSTAAKTQKPVAAKAEQKPDGHAALLAEISRKDKKPAVANVPPKAPTIEEIKQKSAKELLTFSETDLGTYIGLDDNLLMLEKLAGEVEKLNKKSPSLAKKLQARVENLSEKEKKDLAANWMLSAKFSAMKVRLQKAMDLSSVKVQKKDEGFSKKTLNQWVKEDFEALKKTLILKRDGLKQEIVNLKNDVERLSKGQPSLNEKNELARKHAATLAQIQELVQGLGKVLNLSSLSTTVLDPKNYKLGLSGNSDLGKAEELLNQKIEEAEKESDKILTLDNKALAQRLKTSNAKEAEKLGMKNVAGLIDLYKGHSKRPGPKDA